MRTIHIGSKKIEVTKQAYIAFISLVISLFAGLITGFMLKSPIHVIIWTVILYLIMIPLITYKMHCLRTGKCVKLSWFYASIYIILAVINVFTMIGLFVSERPAISIYNGTFGKK